MYHQSLLLPKVALNRVAGQWAAALGIGDTHALRATDTQCGRFASDGGVGRFIPYGPSALAVGVVESLSTGTSEEGALALFFGRTGAGLTLDGNQLWTEDSPGVLDAAETYDNFSGSVAAGDFDAISANARACSELTPRV